MSYIPCTKCLCKTRIPFFLEENDSEVLCEVCYRLEMGIALVANENFGDMLLDKIQFTTTSTSTTDKPTSKLSCWNCQRSEVLVLFVCNCLKTCVCIDCHQGISSIECSQCSHVLKIQNFHSIRETYHFDSYTCPTCQLVVPFFAQEQHMTMYCLQKKEIKQVTSENQSYFIYSQGLEYFNSHGDITTSSTKRLMRS
jgi:hypothetical protein